MAVQNKIVTKKYNTLNFQRTEEKKKPVVSQRLVTVIGALLFFLTGGLVLVMIGITSLDPGMALISIVILGALVYVIVSTFKDDYWE